jgi:hypothetical protein
VSQDWKPAVNDQVALVSDTKIRGRITQVANTYSADDPIFYYIAWKGYSCDQIPYLKKMLILEKDLEDKGFLSKIADKIKAF